MEEDIRVRNRRSRGRRSSSILKIKNPLADLDPNQPLTEVVIPRKKARISTSRRVSFAETYQVKEFPRDSPHRWMPDPECEDEPSPEVESLPDIPLHTSKSEIQGLDKLLTGAIQSSPSETCENDLPPAELAMPDENGYYIPSGPDHTMLPGDDMDMTDIIDKSQMIEVLKQPITDEFGDNYGDSFISERIFVPDKKFSSENNVYKVDQESDFRTLVNTSINKYTCTSLSSSQAMSAGSVQTSVTSSTGASTRKPFANITDNSAFKPVEKQQVGMVDGLSFLKLLGSKPSQPDRDNLEDKTIVFENNDLEETEVISDCFKNDESQLLISDTVKAPSFLKSFKKKEDVDDCTMIFGKNNDMECTEVIGGKINFGKSLDRFERQGENTVFLGNDMEETVSLTSKINNFTAHATDGNDLTFGTRKGVKSGLFCRGEDEKTQVFDKGDDMEHTEMLTGKVVVIENEKDLLYEIDCGKTDYLSNQMDETGLLTGKIELAQSSNLLKKNRTVLFSNNYMDETGFLTGKIELAQSSKMLEKTNKTEMFMNDDLDETGLLTGKIELAQSSKLLEKRNKTEIFNDENIEETGLLTGKIDLRQSSKILEKTNKTTLFSNDRMEETGVLTHNLKTIGCGNLLDDNKTSVFADDLMEETGILTGKIDFDGRGRSQTEGKIDKTILFSTQNNMDQTSALTTKIDLPHHDNTVNSGKTILSNDVMEETKGVTGKIELDGSEHIDKVEFTKETSCKVEISDTVNREKEEITFKTTETETQTFRCDLDLHDQRGIETFAKIEAVEDNANVAKTDTDTVDLNEDADYSGVLTGNIEFVSGRKKKTSPNSGQVTGVDVEQKKGDQFDGKIENKSNRTIHYTDENNMEETRAVGGQILVNKEELAEGRNTGKKENDQLPNITSNKTILFSSGMDIDETKALTTKLELEAAPGKKTLQFGNSEVMEETKPLTTRLDLCTENPTSDQLVNDIQLQNGESEKQLDVEKKGIDLVGIEEQYADMLDFETTQICTRSKRGSFAQKLTSDLNRDSDVGITQGDETDGFFLTKYKSMFENIKQRVNPEAEGKTEANSIDAMAEKMGVNQRRSIGLQSRTPLGKGFGQNKEVHSEMRPHCKGSTVKLSERVSQTELKVPQKNGSGHQPLHCSKELFTDEPDKSSPGIMEMSCLPDLESRLNVTVRDRQNNSLHHGQVDIHTMNGITDEELPMDMITSSTLTGMNHDTMMSSQMVAGDTTGSSTESRSTIDASSYEEYLKQSMLNDTEGPMTVESFLKRVQAPAPQWLSGEGICMSRKSIAMIKRVNKDSISGKLEAKYLLDPYVEVYSKVAEASQETLQSVKIENNMLTDRMKTNPPAVFDIAMTGSQEMKEEIREKLKDFTRSCGKAVDRKWKEMKLECHQKYLSKIKKNRELLSDEVDRIVQASNDLQEQLSPISNVTDQLDNLISEFEEKPLPTPEDIENWQSLEKEEVKYRQDLNSLEESRLKLETELADVKREKERLEEEQLSITMVAQSDDDSSMQAEINELEEKLDTLESLLEWHIEDYDEDFISFLFYGDTLRLSINKQREPDNGQTKIASAHVQSLLDKEAKPVQKLIHSIILDRINGESPLLQSYGYISQLPELLHKLSQMVMEERSLHRQIVLIGLKYLTTVYEDFIVVEKWSLKTLRKVNIKFTFNINNGIVKIVPNVNISMGKFRPESVLEQIATAAVGPNYLCRICDVIDLDSLTDAGS